MRRNGANSRLACTRKQLQAARMRIEQAERQLGIIERRVEVGISQAPELIEARIRLAEARAALTVLEAEFAAGVRGYTIEPGDTLSEIARKHGVSAGDLRAWNDLRANSIRVGDRIYISPPKGGGEKDEDRNTSSAGSKLEQYDREKRTLPYRERLPYALNLLEENQPEELLSAILLDLQNYAEPLGADEEILAKLDGILPRLEDASPAYQQAFLLRAWLLHRLGEIKEAEALFKTGMDNRWMAVGGKKAFEYYAELLSDANFIQRPPFCVTMLLSRIPAGMRNPRGISSRFSNPCSRKEF